MTNYSRSVLKSNGLPRPKIRLKKFGFSSKSVPANIAKKLPPQCCSKPLLIPFFNFSHKRPTFAFAGESGYTLGFAQRNRTQRLTRRNRGPSLLRTQRGIALPAKYLLFHRAFIYIHFPVLCDPSLSATVLSQTFFHYVFQLLAQTAHVCFHE